MARRRYSPEEIRAVLAAAREASRPLTEMLAKHSIPERTYHHWRVRFLEAEVTTPEQIHALKQQVRKLQREKLRLLEDIALQRELLGKPWRR